MFEKGMKPCPKCLTRYINWRETECHVCYYKEHPAELEALEKRRAARDKLKRDLKKSRNAKIRALRAKISQKTTP
jgi:hypothetical protein